MFAERPGARVRYGAALVVLVAGATAYLARPTDPAIFGWLDRVGLHAVATAARAARSLVCAHVHLPSWVRGSASDAAYAFALGALLADAPPAILGLGVVVLLGHEVGQGLGVFAGTFDVADLAVLLVSFAFARFLFHPPTLENRSFT